MRWAGFIVRATALSALLPGFTDPPVDSAAIEANMAEDFRQIDGAGNVETKLSFVNGIISPDLEIDPTRSRTARSVSMATLRS